MHPFSFHERIISERIIICDRWLQVLLNCPSDSSDLIPCRCLNLWWICEFCSWRLLLLPSDEYCPSRLLRTIASVPIRRILSEYYLSSNICQTILTNAPDDCFCYYLGEYYLANTPDDCSCYYLTNTLDDYFRCCCSYDNDVFTTSALDDYSWRLRLLLSIAPDDCFCSYPTIMMDLLLLLFTIAPDDCFCSDPTIMMSLLLLLLTIAPDDCFCSDPTIMMSLILLLFTIAPDDYYLANTPDDCSCYYLTNTLDDYFRCCCSYQLLLTIASAPIRR